jgi:large subunit ribosomal protein L21
MYAIVDISGKQFKVSKDENIITPRLDGDVGAKVEFDRVLMLSKNNTKKIGTPTVEGAKVEATIVEHGRDEKIVVFKKKRRKGYKVKHGHRQPNTKIHVDKIVA